ncbi:MAG: hypothetical protein ABI781_14445 [Burkholderiales bacterium]
MVDSPPTINIAMSRLSEPVRPSAKIRPASAHLLRASRSSFAACVSAALALNLIALAVFASVATAWQGESTGRGGTSWITATTLDRPAATTAANEEPAPGTEPATPSERPKPARPERRLMPSPPAPLPSAETAGEPMRFYGFSEVDRPAEPEPDSDWNLDPAALDAFGVQALVFDIFISRTGEVIDCKIIEPQSLPDEARAALEDRLRQTVLQPAWRHDVAVASVRRIEISVVAQGS